MVHHGFWADWVRLAAGRGWSGHQHPEIEVNQLDQDGELLHGGRTLQLRAGQSICYWGGFPHGYVRVAQPLTVRWVTIPLEHCHQWGLPQSWLANLLVGEALMLPEQGRMEEWIPAIQQGGTAQRIAELELNALLLRQAQALPQDSSSDAGDVLSSGSVADRVLAWCHRHYREPFTSATCAAAVDCHPATAMTAFKKRFGLTILQCVIQLRLAEAARRLISDDGTVLEIALSVGFASQSRFYECFSSSFGLSPARYRKRFS
jgi:AraC-like DNA-binding protein